MAERKLYKTRLCVLYQKGRCSRQTCSFAHGDAELRRSFRRHNGGRDYRVGDLRDKLDRRLSPQRSYSSGRDPRGRQRFRRFSPSRSIEKKSDRKRRKKQHHDGPPEFSGNLKISNGIEDIVKEGKIIPDSKVVLQEQLKEVQLDINMLEQRKLQLEIYGEEKDQEADILSSRIKELETQLQKEKEECRRIGSKIKKFVKAHNRHSQIQDELKRSQDRLQKLGHQLGSDSTKVGVNEEDSSINIMSDGETTNYHSVNPQNDKQTISSPNKKKLHPDRDTGYEYLPEANLMKDGGQQTESVHLKKVSRWNMLPTNHGPLADESKLRQKNISTSCFSAEKVVKNVRPAPAHVSLPSTGMAAHAIDEDVEVEVEKMEEVDMASIGTEKGATLLAKGLPLRLPPPPPLPRNAYIQYVGDDENVDVVD